MPLLIEGLEIVTIECWRGRERLQRALGGRELAVERRGIHARGIEQPALGGGTVVGECPPHENTSQQGSWQHRAKYQDEKVDPK